MPNPILSSLILPVKDQETGEVTNVEYDLPASGSSITVDEEISSTSTNPVQNKVISDALGEKANIEDLGTAASRDIPTSGNANVTQVVIGSDTRLTNARPASDVSDWAKADTKPTYTAAEVGAIPTTIKGANSGVAELDENGKVPSSQLPSYVDDVLEYDSVDDLPLTGETGKIYVVLDTNKTYRWSGSAYVVISPSLALGETSSTAYRGDRGKTAYDHSQTKSGNPHNVTKSDVGLGNVGNFKAVSTVASQGLSDTEKSNARANIGAGTSSLALGTSSSTAYRGDYGNSAYAHAVTNKGSAFSSGLYKITTNSEGHVTAATAVEKADITGLGIPGSDTNTHRPIQINGTEILGNNTTALNLKAGSNVSVTDSNGTVTIAATDTTYGVVSTSANGLAPKVTDTSKFLKGDGTWATPTNTTYNFAGTTFNSGNQNTAEHNANNALKNGNYYYSSNGPATSLGASTDDGALYVQSYSDSWVAQIAQDYRNGNIFVRGKNNGTWQSWKKPDAGTVNGYTVAKSVPSDAVFTDTKYTAATAAPGDITTGTASAGSSGNYARQDHTHKIGTATTSAYGATKLNSATNSTSTTEAATPSAVKAAYDLAASKGTGTVTSVKVGSTSYSPSSGVISLPAYPSDTNNAVTQTATTTSANYEVLFSSTADNTTRTEGARKNSNLLFNPNTGNLQATQLNGVTIGSSPKFTDTNTWRGIQNNLTSDSTTDSLSAAQGKELNTNKADKSATVSTITWDSTNKKLTKTINGSTTDVVTGATILGGLTKSQVTTALGYTPPTSDTNTHRPIQCKGTQILGNDTTALNFAQGSNVTLSNSGGTITIAATDSRDFKVGTSRSGASVSSLYFVYST